MEKYKSTKTYCHEVGLSVAFRQWRAEHSHCKYLHGYALAFKFLFVAETLDAHNWVVDFGGLKQLKEVLKATFDHKTIVAEDDPQLPLFKTMDDLGVADVMVFQTVGCEAFAKAAYCVATEILKNNGMYPRVKVESVEVKEHGANSAIYEGDQL